jgi:hypothetical protein
MKRIFLAAMASSMLALAAPGIASAAHNGKRHGGHRSRTHAGHAKSAHVVTFTARTAAGASSGAPSTPTTTAGETVGTVTSFTNGVLTITLGDGSTVSGKATEATEIQCQSATPPASPTDDENQGGGGNDQSGSDGGGQGAPRSSSGPIEAQQHADSLNANGGGDGQDEGEHGAESCTVAALIPGAVVREAELKVSSAGAVWEKVDLVQETVAKD